MFLALMHCFYGIAEFSLIDMHDTLINIQCHPLQALQQWLILVMFHF